jgi:hypothetical protein
VGVAVDPRVELAERRRAGGEGQRHVPAEEELMVFAVGLLI